MHRRVRRGLVAPGRVAIASGAALVGILVCAALVRLIGIDHGRPFADHQDEWLVFKPALTMVHERDWNPHIFWYSSLLVDIQAVLTAALRLFGGPTLETDQNWVFGNELLPVQFRYLLGGRLLVLSLGLATIIAVFEIGRRLRGRLVGLAAAALLAAMPLHIADSRQLTTDVPLAFFCALTLLFTVIAESDQRPRSWLLAGVCAGLAASTKWSGVLVLGVPLLAYILAAHDVRGIAARFRSRTPYLIGAAALLALVITTPAVLLDNSSVMAGIRLQLDVYGQRRPGVPSDSLYLNLSGLAAGLGPITAVLAGLGLVRFLVRPRRRVELTIPAFVAATLIFVSLPARQYDRNLLPILPYLAVAAACLVGDLPAIVRGVAGRLTAVGPETQRRATAVLVATALTAALVWGLAAGVASGEAVGGKDTRTIAREWLLAHVAHNTVIARERGTPMLEPDEFRLRPTFHLPSRSLDWYRNADTQLLVTSSYEYGLILDNPNTPGPEAWYREMFTLPEVFHVEPGPGRPGPTIRIYELAPFTRPGGSTGG